MPIAAGPHVIEIENTAGDWLSIPRYTFTEVRDPRFAPLDQLGLRTDDFAVFWLHDEESNWYNDKLGKAPREMAGAKTELLGLQDGRYRIEWWDTRKGPAFVRDLAGKAMRQP